MKTAKLDIYLNEGKIVVKDLQGEVVLDRPMSFPKHDLTTGLSIVDALKHEMTIKGYEILGYQYL